MKITDELISYLGQLSRLELQEEEKQNLKEDLNSILSYMDELSKVDTRGVTELSQPFSDYNCFREDEVKNEDARTQMLANAPDRKGDYFKVHTTVGEEA